MLWILFITVHLVGLVGYTVFLRKSALSHIDKVLLAALLQTAVFLPILAVIGINGGVNLRFTAEQWVWLVASAGLVVALHLTAINALKHLEASVWSIIFNLRLLLLTVTGYVFLHELPTPLQLIGGAIIFTSIIALNLHRHRRFATWPVVMGFFAVLVFVTHTTIEKFNLDQVGFISYMLVVGVLATIALWIWVWVRGIRIGQVRDHLDAHTAQLLLLRAMSAWGYLLALKYGSLAVTNYVSGMSVPLTVLVGIYLLKERDHLREKITATIIAVVGLSFILASHLQG